MELVLLKINIKRSQKLVQLVPGAQILWAAQKRAQSGGGEGGGGEFEVLEGKRMPEVFQTSKECSTLQKNNLRSRAHTCTCCS